MYTGKKHSRLFRIILAFTYFAGKPLRVTDAADVLTDEELATVEKVLLKLANYYRSEDEAQWGELHTLAASIERNIAA